MGRWDATLHPRGPGGRFVKKGASGGGASWAERISKNIGEQRTTTPTGHYHHTRGTDQRDWLVENALQVAGKDQYRRDPRGQIIYGDRILLHIANKQGYDALPRVGSAADLNAAKKAGGVEVWRGVTGHDPNGGIWGWGPHKGQPVAGWDPDQTPARRLERFREGPVEYGDGLYGQGVYTSISQAAAKKFGQVTPGKDKWDAKVDPTSVQRMVLSPDAKVLEYGSPEADRLVANAATRFDFHHGTDWKGQAADRRRAARNRVLDLGRLAAAAGYDAIRVPQGLSDGSGQNAPQYNILNRTAVLFEKPKPPPRTKRV